MASTLTAEVAKLGEEPLARVILSLAEASREIAELARAGSTGKLSSSNPFGDQQLEIDVRADAVVMRHLELSGAVVTASSEERPLEIPVTGGEEGSYSVAYDPLGARLCLLDSWAGLRGTRADGVCLWR